ncbi:MAG: hypothetical protein K6U80_18290 [Firmicutes bacterium]|nr:hypothetical protein [Bacillota bacterium]
MADNGLVTVTTTAYEKVKEVRAVLTEEDKGRTFTIRFSHRGKARLTVKDEAGNVHLEEEYSSVEEVVQTEEVKLKKKSGAVLIAVLELASPDGVTPAENRIFEVSYGRAEFEYGVVQALPVSFGTTVHSVRLFYTGSGVVFQVSTDGGIKWQKIEPGREVALDTPGTSLLVKILLLIDPATVLYDYRIDINPYHDMSFTGKFLEPEIGLIYFGGRWYEPGIGRWITPDPSEDGLNWYEYCRDNPIECLDTNGFSSTYLTPMHMTIIKLAAKFGDLPVRQWSTFDIIKWKFSRNNNYLFEFKKQWVHGYRSIILNASEIFGISKEIVAGIAFTEVGGDPLWIDDVAYLIRSIGVGGKDPDKTSFGNVSMQVITAAEALGYNPKKLSGPQKKRIIQSLKDPEENIFIVALYLSQLKIKHFKNQKVSLNDQILILCAAYNQGALSIDILKRDLSYGKSIIKRIDIIRRLL